MNIKALMRPRRGDGELNLVFWGIMAALGLVLIGAIAMWIYWRQLASDPMTRIDNLDDYASDMPAEVREALFRGLYGRINEYMEEGKRPPYAGAKIRSDSYNEEVDTETSTVQSKFIVDIDAVKQTYQVEFGWPYGEGREFSNYYAYLRCPTEEQIIFEGQECTESPLVVQSDPGNALGKLPYTKLNEETGRVEYAVRLNGSKYLMVTYQACGNEYWKEKYETGARQWLEEESGIDLERYELRFVDTCDGSF